MTRWVILIESDGFIVVGAGSNRTYATPEAAQRDADRIADQYDQVHVLPLVGIEEQ